MSKLEAVLKAKISELATTEGPAYDPAHDFSHFERVVETAKRLCEIEGGNLEVVTAAAWLHDLVIVPKNDPRRSQASRLSAEAAKEFLRSTEAANFLEESLNEIAHAVEAHSFSAGIVPRTLEAKIVQDADRLDGLGAIGIARLFITAGLMKRPIYSAEDPLCKSRPLDDQKFTIDHIFKKLFVVAESMQTKAGREEASRRLKFIKDYLRQLETEI